MSLTPKTGRYYCIMVYPLQKALDGHGRDVLDDIHAMGLSHISAVRSSKLYFLQGGLSAENVRAIAEELLTDPVAETCTIAPGLTQRPAGALPAVEVHYKPGVMNPVALTAIDAARRLIGDTSHEQLIELQTGRRYEVDGARSADELERIASRVLANSCIETWFVAGAGRQDALPTEFPQPPDMGFTLQHVNIADLDDDGLQKLSREGHLFLSLEEMRTIRDHFAALGREPTDIELETLAQTWSEHCVHKTLKSAVTYRGEDFGKPGEVTVTFDNLLRDTIAKATNELDRDWCLSVFVDNAGVVAFDDEYGIAFKAETHNHPSAIEPYGGSATGIGGCIRDIMGCGLGAKPIASTDVFCLAPPDFQQERLPREVLHPRRILKGVVRGVRDYGNRMGIPTVAGALHFDDGYLGNPLVFVGCVGLIPRKFVDKEPRTGDVIVVAGGRTGRDGIHGATFSSAELTDTHADEFSHAVQIGNALQQKKLLDAQLLARDHPAGCLYSAVTDCGAGGLSSAVGEMGEKLGARVDLDDVPLKYPGLRYDEIWISEAQERMVFAVPPENLEAMLGIFEAEEVEATVIGRFAADGKLIVRYRDTVVCELDMAFLHDGLPKMVREATWRVSDNAATALASARVTDSGTISVPGLSAAEPLDHAANITGIEVEPEGGYTLYLCNLLGDWNTCSREWIIRQYDHEVQGRSAIKSLVGPGSGPGDAAVLKPLYDRPGGIALGCGLCPQRTEYDPYLMAIHAIDEALRNVICVGANPDRTAILDNFCWGKVDTPEGMGELVRTCKGAYDAAIAFGLPFISGKDSLNNEFSQDPDEAARLGLPERIRIPGTLLVSALGMIEDVKQCVTSDLKQSGSVIAVASAPVDHVGFAAANACHHKVAGLIRDGRVLAAHDVSEGGLAVALAEMAIAGGLGLDVDIAGGAYDVSIFHDAATTYVLEMSREHGQAAGLAIIGEVTEKPRMELARSGEKRVSVDIDALETAWRNPLAKGGA